MAEWVSAIAEAVTALGLILVALQLNATYQQLRATYDQTRQDHERSRREAAVDKTLTWAASLTQSTSSARKLVDSFDESQCVELEKAGNVRIDTAKKELLYACFPKEERFVIESTFITLTPSQSASLRYTIVKYLNTLEAILSAWRHSVADAEIITEEFRYMLSPQHGAKLLKQMRIALGENNYPAISAFEAHLLDLARPEAGKKRLG